MFQTIGRNTYRFDIEHRPNGSIIVRCGALSADGERSLARKLVELGASDGAVEAGRPGRTDWTVGSLHAFAAHTLSEGDKGFARGIYAPWPARELHPALQAAVSAARVRREQRA